MRRIFVLLILVLLVLPVGGDVSWYRDVVVYEVFVRSFYDADGDGVGDIRGLISRLDYLNDGKPGEGDDLEIGAIWLMPICESPSYHGYDVTDYYKVNPKYGSMKDFETLLVEAHKRGIKIFIDLVINHTSSKHPYFLEAKKDLKSPKRDWYVWKKDMPGGWGHPWAPGSTSRQVWHKDPTKVDDHHYYGVFYFGMPDLNYRNPEVRKEMQAVARFWLEKGVDGFRLDAIRYLVEEGPRLGQMDIEDTHKVLAEFYQSVKAVKKDSVLVGEVWTDMDTVASYYKSLISPAQVDSCFNFDLAGAIVGGVKTGNFKKINVVMEVGLETLPGGAIDSVFLTNHDMNRIASILGGDVPKLKLAASVLLTFPGVPYIYYGEEIAMQGKKPDEMIRRPLPWNGEKFGGFTKAERPWIKPDLSREGFHVAAMQKDKGSLLNHYKKFIRMRNKNVALRRGAYRNVVMNHASVYGYLRIHKEQVLLVVHNFSGSVAEGVVPEGKIVVLRDVGSGKDVSVVGSVPAYGTRVFQVELKDVKKEG